MSASILVTGATGTVGRHLVASLAHHAVAVRAAARIPTHESPFVEPQRFDFHDPTTFPATFAGIDTMFLVRPPALAHVADLAPALRAGIAAGLRHVVFLSVQGAGNIPVLPHARIERWLRSASVTWTFLRPSFFDQNLISVHGAEIRQRSELSVPAGQGRTAFIDARDVAHVAAHILGNTLRHAGRAYTLTGSEALTYSQVAAILTSVCGREIRYTRPGLLHHIRHAHTDLGLGPALVAATSIVYTTARLGLAAGLTTDTADLLGRPPTTLLEFVQRERAHFLAAPDTDLS